MIKAVLMKRTFDICVRSNVPKSTLEQGQQALKGPANNYFRFVALRDQSLLQLLSSARVASKQPQTGCA